MGVPLEIIEICVIERQWDMEQIDAHPLGHGYDRKNASCEKENPEAKIKQGRQGGAVRCILDAVISLWGHGRPFEILSVAISMTLGNTIADFNEADQKGKSLASASGATKYSQ